MVARLIPGQRTWSLTRDEAGYREYKIAHLVETDTGDGPAVVMNTPGLPLPGAPYAFDNDLDFWCWCRPNMTVTIHSEKEGDPPRHYKVEQLFSNKPPDLNSQRCQDIQIEDPLLEPPKVSGSFVKYTEEATHNRFGYPILTSSHEMLRGPQVEFDRNRLTVKIEQNVLSAFQAYVLPARMMDTVNGFPLWGLPTRTIKLSSGPWEQKFYGNCNVYYTRTLEFDISFDTFDRNLLDEGSKVLHGHWDTVTGSWVLDNIAGATPEYWNPSHFDRFKDRAGENCRVVLNGRGEPSGVVIIRSPARRKFYVSILSPNLGKALTNTVYWREHTRTDVFWNADIAYAAGDVVFFGANDDVYFALSANNNDPPPSANWQLLPNGIRHEGDYSATTTYSLGSRVEDRTVAAAEEELAGNVYVEKYHESDFLLLGIPVIF